MARFIDLESEETDNGTVGHPNGGVNTLPQNMVYAASTTAMTRALQCYPIVIAIVSSIDLISLDSLARASRTTYSSLIQYRSALIASTLRCSNEAVPLDPEETFRYRARAIEGSRFVNVAKASSCAKDMVGECRRCATVICRNCAIKPPTAIALRERHRRLCKTCARAPLTSVASPPLDPNLPCISDAFRSSMCNCASSNVWLCQPCGRTVRNADHDYQCIWRWRTQYGESLGCLGTGIGDGDRGVICGKEKECLAARDREQETDCDAEDARGGSVGSPWSASDASSSYASSSSSSGSSPPTSYFTQRARPTALGSLSPAQQSIEALVDEYRTQDRTPSPLLGPGYERHEIEGIGGIVKRKLVRMVRVGACVPEWQDERGHSPGSSSSRVLGHEARGEVRSWCGWCSRVVPGKKDLDELAKHAALIEMARENPGAAPEVAQQLSELGLSTLKESGRIGITA